MARLLLSQQGLLGPQKYVEKPFAGIGPLCHLLWGVYPESKEDTISNLDKYGKH